MRRRIWDPPSSVWARRTAGSVSSGTRRRPGQDDRRGARDQRAPQVDDAARGQQRDRQRAEELQGHRQAQPDPVDGQVQRQVHGGEDQRQGQDRAPLLPGERGEPRPHRGEQHRGGHPLFSRWRPTVLARATERQKS